MYEISSPHPQDPAKLCDLERLEERLEAELGHMRCTAHAVELRIRHTMEELDKRLSQIEVQLARLLEGV